MKKVIVFIFFSILLSSCSKEEDWIEDRTVRFILFQNISWNTNDGDVSQINCSIQYSIIGESDTVYLQNAYNFNSSENLIPIPNHHSSYYNLKNYDHLEFKLTISSTSHPLNSKYTLIGDSEMILTSRYSDDYRLQRDTLTSFNNSDTTIHFTWSPANFN